MALSLEEALHPSPLEATFKQDPNGSHAPGYGKTQRDLHPPFYRWESEGQENTDNWNQCQHDLDCLDYLNQQFLMHASWTCSPSRGPAPCGRWGNRLGRRECRHLLPLPPSWASCSSSTPPSWSQTSATVPLPLLWDLKALESCDSSLRSWAPRARACCLHLWPWSQTGQGRNQRFPPPPKSSHIWR